MSEFAEKSIQEMIPELKQMEKIGLFSSVEIRKIIRKRRELEYKLRRKTKELNDYLQYITYEEQVMMLLKSRRKKTNCTLMRKEIDVCIVKRIHKLFQLACTRFPEFVDLWLKHIGFCRKRKEKSKIGNIFAQALKIHPHNAGLWVMAAKYELEENLSMANARILLQRSLRMNPTCKQLYVEYFRMELLNAEQLRKRKEVLDLKEIVETESFSSMLNGEIGRAVFKNAVEVIPNDVEFILAFLEVCQIFTFTSWLEDDIFEVLKSEQFCKNEMAQAAVARRPIVAILRKGEKLFDIEPVKESFRLFDEAIQRYQSEILWEMYLDTCLDVIKLPASSKHKDMILSHSMTMCLRAADEDRLTEKMAVCWMDMLLKTGQSQFALDVIPMLTSKFNRNISLWSFRFRLLILSDSDADVVLSQLKEASKLLGKNDEAIELYKLITEWLIASRPDKLIELLETAILNESKAVGLYAKEVYLDWFAVRKEKKFVRELYARLISMAPRSTSLLYKYVEFELSQSKIKMTKVRRAYDAGLLEYGSSDVDIWLKYIELEMNHPIGKPENVGQLYYNAVKCLEGSLENKFITRYTLLNSGRSLNSV